jgi:hypothetical protein
MSAELVEDRDFVETDDEPEEAAADDNKEPAPAGDEDPLHSGLVLDAGALKAAYAKIARLINLSETRNARVLKSILADRQKEWTGAERRGCFLWLPLSALGLNGGAIRVRVAEEQVDEEEEDEEAADEDEEAYEPISKEEEAAAADSDEEDVPEPKKRKLSAAQQARGIFQSADVKQLLRAALGDKVQEANAAACEAVEAAERADAEARLRQAREITHEKKRAQEVARAEKQLARVGREPKAMPPPDAGLGEANEMLGQVLSQLGGSLWHLVKRNIAEQEDGEAALAALVEAAKDRPAALLETEAFKAAFQAATGEEMPALELTPCAGCRSLGCKQCRVAPLPPTEADGSR